eukprot:SRR837773.6585.p1 GENE.SRR837773.6585~~SRR837773.6585.p1  ORF type:complete len:186 (+),score=41.91 SRR837773.6585:37-558(+)
MDDHGLIIELLWIFSTYLESVAMLPQYIYCYRDGENTCPLVSSYVLTMGGYRMVFGLSWVYHYWVMPYYLDVSSLVSGMLGVLFFCDYLAFKFAKRSTLSRICISVDDTIREAEEAARDIVTGESPLLEHPRSPSGVAPERIGRPSRPGKASWSEVEMSSEVIIHHHDSGTEP